MRLRFRLKLLSAIATFFVLAFPAEAQTRLSQWDRGISVDSGERADMRVYLWFYEWHMFGAMEPGQHTNGTWKNRIEVDGNRLAARIESENPGLSLEIRAVADGAELDLRVANESERRWPDLASMIACFNPGPQSTRNRQFANTDTWFHASDGLTSLAIKAPREIHYNAELREAIDAEANDGKYVWSPKWPASEVDAIDGLIIRESTDRKWVTGIAWERFLSAQGHNPWECMHLSAHVGPLKPGQERSIVGRIWLFRGDKENLLSRYQAWKSSLASR
jgi:hypothetical protein